LNSGRLTNLFPNICRFLNVCSKCVPEAARRLNDRRLAAFFFAKPIPFWFVSNHSYTVFRMMQSHSSWSCVSRKAKYKSIDQRDKER
jgi:hypothetical protein